MGSKTAGTECSLECSVYVEPEVPGTSYAYYYWPFLVKAAVLELASLEPDSLEEYFVEDDFASALQTLCEGIFPCWGSHPLSHCIEVRHLRI